MTVLFYLLFSSRCFPFTAFCPLLSDYSSLPGAFRLLFTLRSFSVGGLSLYLPTTPSPHYLLAVPEMRVGPS
jgi:hypothetical protein